MSILKKQNKLIFCLRLAFYLMIFSFLIHNSFEYLDPDFGWHLAAGQQVINEKTVPTTNLENFTIYGAEWVDHEWLADAGAYAIYNKFGYAMLTIIFALIMILTLILLNIFTQNFFVKNKNSLSSIIYIMVWQSFGVLAMSPHLGIRMQEITILNLLLLFIILYSAYKTEKIKTLFWLLPLFFFWANLHAGFLIGLVILFSFVGLEIIKKIFAKLNILTPLDYKDLLIYITVAFLSAGATLFTPYGIKLYSFLAGYSNNFYLSYISEWLSFYRCPIIYTQIFYFAIFTGLVIIWLFIGQRAREKNKFNLFLFIWAIIFLFLAMKSRRHFPLFFVSSFPFIIFFLNHEIGRPLNFKSSKLKKFLIVYVFACLLTVSVYFLLDAKWTDDPWLENKTCREYPCEAINFLKNDPKYLSEKMFNFYGWGGYLTWNWPEKKLFIDGRMPQYEFRGHSLLEEYY
ncbi:MAG: hypothetical protein ABH881_03545, partial [bacterium]